MKRIRIVKRHPGETEGFIYPAQLIRMDSESVLVQAEFGLATRQVDELVMATGDVFIERYYFQRWYNIYQVHDGKSERVKGWYCNISRPVVLVDDLLIYEDLFLDLIFYPDGRMKELDREEFEAANFRTEIRQAAEGALVELKSLHRPYGMDRLN